MTLSDALPANTTFAGLTQNSGAPFTVATPAPGTNGTMTLTASGLAPGASATFTLGLNVNANTPLDITLKQCGDGERKQC